LNTHSLKYIIKVGLLYKIDVKPIESREQGWWEQINPGISFISSKAAGFISPKVQSTAAPNKEAPNG